MVFSSITFLYYFLPAIIAVYFAVPQKYRNTVLLLGSLLFYFSGEPKYTVLLLFSAAVDYTHSLIIDRRRGSKAAKAALVSSIAINLGMLFIFKYSDFLVGNINWIFGTSMPLPGLKLPIGISFFTFQTMSYTIDVYRGQAEPQRNPLDLAAYVALFPQLIAGPIVRYKTIAEEMTDRTHSYENFASGIQRFVIGLGKKVLIANTLGELAVIAKTTPSPSALFYWIGAIAFALQIYYDFSGYSDMAIGLGRLFGFHFPENFNYPYISKSISEFWNRWHMSLGQWFRDYVYIPLGGNRRGRSIWIRNILLVWLMTGFWHGAGWNFVLWGLYLGLFIVAEKLFLERLLKRLPAVMSHAYVLLVILISFVLFSNESAAALAKYLKGMFGQLDIPLVTASSLYYLRSYLITFITAAAGATPLVKKAAQKLAGRIRERRLLAFLAPLAPVTLLIIVTGYLVDSSFNPFLYFRF